MLIVSRDEEELEKSSFGRTLKEKSLGTRLEYRLLMLLLQLSAVSIHERG